MVFVFFRGEFLYSSCRYGVLVYSVMRGFKYEYQRLYIGKSLSQIKPFGPFLLFTHQTEEKMSI